MGGVLLLCIISLIEVYSAASTLAYKSGRFWDPLVKQALFLAAGTLVALVIHRIPCRMFKALPILCWPLSLLLLSITLMGVAPTALPLDRLGFCTVSALRDSQGFGSVVRCTYTFAFAT